ncbi:MAG TPA: peptidase M56, partial [Brevundimonas sp.]|nr:peptidase M56 [Brevundimonas sp.]
AILLDPASLSDSRTADAVLAHELSHLKRGDWLFLVLSRLALALFWINPLVWMLHAALVARTEEAADAAAVSRVDRQTYAHALVRLASQPAANAAVTWSSTAMAGDARSL